MQTLKVRIFTTVATILAALLVFFRLAPKAQAIAGVQPMSGVTPKQSGAMANRLLSSATSANGCARDPDPIIGVTAYGQAPACAFKYFPPEFCLHKTVSEAVASPDHRPVIGTKRTMPYADLFAEAMLIWMQANGLPDVWRRDHLEELAGRWFAPSAQMEMPVNRNLLGAFKKIEGVQVLPDRDCRLANGKYLGKRTFYRLPIVAQPIEPAAQSTHEATLRVVAA